MAIVEEVEEGAEIKEIVEKLKREGNERFGAGEWTAAVEKYKEALDICPPDLDSLRSVLFSNLSAAYIKQSEWKAAAEMATEAIKANVPNEKALERRAFAFSNIPENYQDALQDYEDLKKQFPHRTQYVEKIKEMNQKIAERNEQMKSEMLGKLKQLGDVCLRPFGLSTDSFQVTQNPDGGYNISMKSAGQQ
ncbi:hypothetical protein KIN20_037449 [Parelaphostrongylus tenuis]|uniref:Tetratricopeptide repeat protein 1 n=1 Tax=Parelaphostrongylus tenuis TaxID=148309 RepID=A0AAD5RHZ8_PARTN|nr:hypothetical protein KIN20_037449 [Parelaphostrongylus tenuis]